MQRTRHLRLSLFVVCAAVAAWWSCLWFQRRDVWGELGRAREKNALVADQLEAKKSRYAEARALAVPGEQLSPEERRRVRVAKVVAQFKEERAGRTTPLPPPPPEGPGGDTFRELMDDPEYARLTMIYWKYGWVSTYARRFQWANIPSEKYEKLCELILDRGFAGDDAMMVAQKNGLSPEEAWKAREKVRIGIEAEIQELVGAETYALLERGAHASEANELLRSLETRLSYSDAPLSRQQAERVFAAALETKIRFMLKPEQIEPLIERARPALASDQLEAFRQVVTEFNYGKWTGPVTTSEPKK